MKRIFMYLLPLVAICLSSCSDDNGSDANEWFGIPESVVVAQGTSVIVSCDTNFAEGVLSQTNFGVAYASIVDGGISEFVDATDVSLVGKTITAELKNLQPNTTYVAYAFVDVSSDRILSDRTAFSTGAGPAVSLNFGTPSATNVEASTATIACSFDYEGEATITEVYFTYSSGGASQRINVSTAEGAKSANLNSLSPESVYTFTLSVVAGATYNSAAGTFTTKEGSVAPPVGSAEYSGWMELPAQDKANSDHHYAYHITDVSSGRGWEYRNYGVCYSEKYQNALWVAAPLHDVYIERNTDRTDAYDYDPQVSSNIQSSTGGWGSPFNRGHMLSSADRYISRFANEQVFYMTNISPQYSANFNTGGGSWNEFEGYIDTQWRGGKDTLYLVLGCLYENPTHKQAGSTIPSHYYAVLLRAKSNNSNKTWVRDLAADKLQCAAFIIEHENQRGIEAEMVTVEEMEERAGHEFFVNVPNAPKSVMNRNDWNY